MKLGTIYLESEGHMSSERLTKDLADLRKRSTRRTAMVQIAFFPTPNTYHEIIFSDKLNPVVFWFRP